MQQGRNQTNIHHRDSELYSIFVKKSSTSYNQYLQLVGYGDNKETFMGLIELEPQLAKLSRAEKAQLLQVLVRDISNAWPGIEKTPEVVGGAARIVRTRIPVWVLVNWRRLGWSEAKILENYSTLRAVDLVNAWAYADAHQEEIEREILENEEA
jgi:uncharacterized protein (DUF433 family)